MLFNRIKKLFFTNWMATKVHWDMLRGSWKISNLEQPIVTIFGGSRFQQDNLYTKKAYQLASMLVNEKISVLTGGGPGIMEAANCGALPTTQNHVKSMGIGVRKLDQANNPCVQDYFKVGHFFTRKWLLTNYSAGFVVFPGGFGTLDEFAEVLTLIQTSMMKPVPIILVGTEYWEPILAWITDEALQHDLIAKKDIKLFSVSDDLDEIFCLIRDECKAKPGHTNSQ